MQRCLPFIVLRIRIYAGTREQLTNDRFYTPTLKFVSQNQNFWAVSHYIWIIYRTLYDSYCITKHERLQAYLYIILESVLNHHKIFLLDGLTKLNKLVGTNCPFKSDLGTGLFLTLILNYSHYREPINVLDNPRCQTRFTAAVKSDSTLMPVGS